MYLFSYTNQTPHKCNGASVDMSDGLVIPPTMQPVEPARRSRGRTALWYGILFVAVQFLVVVVFFLIGTTSWFRFHDDYPQLLNIGYGSRVQGLDCDIVLYGDSTPLSGLDPAIIQAKTGLKTCNIC